MSVSEHAFFAQLLGEPKISEFHIMVLIQEYITGFKISMKNSAVFASMASYESICHLEKDLPYNVFTNVVFLSSAALDDFSNIPALTVLHYDIYGSFGLIYDSKVRGIAYRS